MTGLLGIVKRPTFWPAMRDRNYVAIGWAALGDLTPVFAQRYRLSRL